MGPWPKYYIPSHKVIAPLVLEKIFEGFLTYMGVAAILVMQPRPRQQTVIPPSHWGSIWNLIGTVVLEEKIFEKCGRTTDGWTDDGPWLYYKLTNEPKGSGELTIKSNVKLKPSIHKYPTPPVWPKYHLWMLILKQNGICI